MYCVIYRIIFCDDDWLFCFQIVEKEENIMLSLFCLQICQMFVTYQ